MPSAFWCVFMIWLKIAYILITITPCPIDSISATRRWPATERFNSEDHILHTHTHDALQTPVVDHVHLLLLSHTHNTHTHTHTHPTHTYIYICICIYTYIHTYIHIKTSLWWHAPYIPISHLGISRHKHTDNMEKGHATPPNTTGASIWCAILETSHCPISG